MLRKASLVNVSTFMAFQNHEKTNKTNKSFFGKQIKIFLDICVPPLSAMQLPI